MDLDVLELQCGIWGNLRNMQAVVDEPTVSHHAMT
jgi:hypothetical protein